MKIIDLLNKIANGEEVPKKIHYKGDIWYLKQDYSNTLPYYNNGYNNDNLLTGKEKDYFSHSLNDEVEILEEEKELPEKINLSKYYGLNDTEKHIMNKLNEIIDYLKSKGE